MDSLVSKGTNTLKNLLGKKTVDSFKFRTCVKPKLSENRLGETEIVYESLTAQDLLRKRAKTDHFYRRNSPEIVFCSLKSLSIQMKASRA